MDISDLRSPVEVWEAVEGNPKPLADLLRSDYVLSKRERLELADFLEGKLQPVVRPNHRPKKELGFRILSFNLVFYRGHDMATVYGRAGLRYELVRDWRKKRGLFSSKDAAKLKIAVAKRYNIIEGTASFEGFNRYLAQNSNRLKKLKNAKDAPQDVRAAARLDWWEKRQKTLDNK